MAVKIAVTPKYEDEKRQIHSNRLLLYLLLKKLTALSDIFFNFWKLCTWGHYSRGARDSKIGKKWPESSRILDFIIS